MHYPLLDDWVVHNLTAYRQSSSNSFPRTWPEGWFFSGTETCTHSSRRGSLIFDPLLSKKCKRLTVRVLEHLSYQLEGDQLNQPKKKKKGLKVSCIAIGYSNESWRGVYWQKYRDHGNVITKRGPYLQPQRNCFVIPFSQSIATLVWSAH